jgi:hypothetical protein
MFPVRARKPETRKNLSGKVGRTVFFSLLRETLTAMYYNCSIKIIGLGNANSFLMPAVKQEGTK